MMLHRERPTSFFNQKMEDRHGKTSARVCLKMNSLKIFLQESQISICVLIMLCITVKAILKLLYGKKRMFSIHDVLRLLSIVRESWRTTMKDKCIKKCPLQEPGCRYIRILKRNRCELFLKHLMGHFS